MTFMNQKIEAPLHDLLTDPEKIVDVIVVGCNPSSVKELQRVKELRVKRVIALINAVAGQIRAKHVVRLSHSPIVSSIEIDKEVSIAR